MQIRFLIILLLLCSSACNTERGEKSDLVNRETETEITFDKKKWRAKEGLDYPYRDQMLHDIVYNDTVRTLNKDEILELLGEPDRSNVGYLYYMIAQKRLGFWPLHTKTLVIKLSEDSTIDWIKIHE
jgi:hypothetical protein